MRGHPSGRERDSLVASFHGLQAQLSHLRKRWSAVDVTVGAVEHDAAVGGGILAGAVAFRVFLFLVPFAFVLVSGFGFAADAAGRSPRDLAESAGAAGLIASSIDSVSRGSTSTRLTVLLAGGFALVVAARTLIRVLAVVHVMVWGVRPAKLRRSARATTGLIFVVAMGLAMIQALSYVRHRSPAAWTVGTVVFIAVPAAAWLLAALAIFPHAEGAGWRDLLPGAVLVGVGLQALHIFTVVWIARALEHKTEAYGAIGTSLALLLWAYVLGRILTGSAVLNATLWRRRAESATDAG
jgi:membrane protein